MSYTLTMMIHQAATREIAEIQQRMVLRYGVTQMFMSRGIMLDDMTPPSTLPIQNAVEARRLAADHDRSRLEQLYKLVDALETIINKCARKDDIEWAKELSEYVRTHYSIIPLDGI